MQDSLGKEEQLRVYIVKLSNKKRQLNEYAFVRQSNIKSNRMAKLIKSSSKEHLNKMILRENVTVQK